MAPKFSIKPQIPSLQKPSLISDVTPSLSQSKPYFPHKKNSLLFPSRAFSSDQSSSNIVLIGSEQGFITALGKAQDEKLPVIFYFKAVWCGLLWHLDTGS